MNKLFLIFSLIFVVNVAKAMDKKELAEAAARGEKELERHANSMSRSSYVGDLTRYDEYRKLTICDREDVRDLSRASAFSAGFEVVQALKIVHENMGEMMQRLSDQMNQGFTKLESSVANLETRVAALEKTLPAKKE